MTPSHFSVLTSKHYERLARVLNKRQPKFYAAQERSIEILGKDPTNRSGSHDIKKLTSVARGEGQWRLALGRFRFLQYCGLRREDTY
jgi:hypothetical protein